MYYSFGDPAAMYLRTTMPVSPWPADGPKPVLTKHQLLLPTTTTKAQVGVVLDKGRRREVGLTKITEATTAVRSATLNFLPHLGIAFTIRGRRVDLV
jgi:hypothetical protein